MMKELKEADEVAVEIVQHCGHKMTLIVGTMTPPAVLVNRVHHYEAATCDRCLRGEKQRFNLTAYRALLGDRVMVWSEEEYRRRNSK